jgi:hypothetical protein
VIRGLLSWLRNGGILQLSKSKFPQRRNKQRAFDHSVAVAQVTIIPEVIDFPDALNLDQELEWDFLNCCQDPLSMALVSVSKRKAPSSRSQPGNLMVSLLVANIINPYCNIRTSLFLDHIYFYLQCLHLENLTRH